MPKKKRIVIIGATSTIAEHCARLWLDDAPAQLILVGRDAQRIERVALDLKVRNPDSEIEIVEADLSNPKDINTTVESISHPVSIDIALIAHGALPNQTECQDDLNACQNALYVNGISSVLYAEALAKEMEKYNHGVLAIIGSVAGDRGRKSNYVYGAAKGLVTRYAQGLQHRFSNSEVKIVLIKPGPTDTPMTAHLKAKGVKLASAEFVAKQIISGIASRKSVIYSPGKWRFVMMVIRHLPTFVFNKMDI